MKRDFSNESYFNLLLRAKRSVMLRMRGKIFAHLGVFHPQSSKNITLGKGIRVMNGKWIKLGYKTAFSDFARIECYTNTENINNNPKIVIGNNTSFGELAHIGAINSVTIGNNVLAGSKVLIIDHDHGRSSEILDQNKSVSLPRERPLYSKGPISIGDSVWIGDGAIILAGSNIGEGAIIAANSIVKGEVAPYSVFYFKK